jgi:hypothetical protein
MIRVTNSGIEASWGASRPTDQVFASGRPEYVAFVSTADLDPRVDNSDRNPEIFLWELESGVFHQLTDTQPPVINSDPYPSDSGKCIVFSSNGNLDNNDGTLDTNNPGTGFSNTDGSQEVFLFSLKTSTDFPYGDGSFTQVSNGPAGTVSSRPVIGGYWFPRQCQTTAYMSDHDQLSTGLTGTNIYTFDRNAPRTAVKTSEMVAPKEIPLGIQPGDYRYPHISSASPFARGPFVVFQTDADLWRNGSTGNEMFRYRVFHPRMTQYTDIITGSVERPVVSDGGGIIVFQSNGEILDPRRHAREGGEPPFNADGNYEIFRTKGRNKVYQITRTQGCDNTLPSVRDNGTAVTFRSTCDLVPGNNTGGVPQVFLYTQVKGDDPLSTANGCKVSEGCCNEANGCFEVIRGRKPKPRKKDCLDRPRSGCKLPPS